MITIDEMKALDEDLDRRVSEGTFAEGRGQKNAYTCGSCGKSMITVNRNPGTTPMFKGCDYCGGEAKSRMYRIPQDSPPFFEWYRPLSEEEIAEVLEDDDEYGSYSEYIKSGGLAFRRIPDHRLPQETREYIRTGAFGAPTSTAPRSAAPAQKFDVLDFDDAVYGQVQRLGGDREKLELVIDSEIRRGIGRLQTQRDQRRVMDTWQGIDLVELSENRGGYWKVRRKV
jgi:Arc/MetJ-type ribon-helix-helix transcriptional regulator